MNNYFLSLDKELCCGCYACKNICNKYAITMEEDEKGFKYPKVNRNLCVNCGLCKEICVFQYDREERKSPVEAYAIKNKNDNVVINSSSGGAFTTFSDFILDNDGLILGAIFNENLKVIHKSAKTKEERDFFRSSKYVQSDMSDVYYEIKEGLKRNICILFTGTPCQCAAVKEFFKNNLNKDKLFLIDFICHGVPSPKVFQQYTEFLKNIFKSQIKNINFRCKETGFHSQTMKIEFDKGIYLMPSSLDIYYNMFQKDLIERPSCYKCKYACLNRVSDITMGDFFKSNINNLGFDNSNGISQVIINSEKGKQLFNSIKENIQIKEIDILKSLQPQLKRAINKPKNLNKFWNDYDKYGFNYIIKKYTTYSRKTEIIIFIEKILYNLELDEIFFKIIRFISKRGRNGKNKI